MVLMIYFIFLMLFLTTCTGIKCVDKIQVKLSTSEIALNNIETIFLDLKTSGNVKCQVHMKFDAIAQEFTIKFGQSVEFPHLRSIENTYIHIVTSIILGNAEKDVNQTSIKTIAHFVCYSNDQCDRQLVIEHVNWLITTDYRNLKSTIRRSILVQDDKKNECTIGNGSTVQSCYNEACSWYYSMETKQGEGKCEKAYPLSLPTLEFTTEITMFEKLKKQEEKATKSIRAIFKHNSSIKYWCALNNCNNQKVSELIKEAVSKENDLWAMNKIHTTNRK